MNCPNCQQTLEENARFCASCGLIFIGDMSRGSNCSAATSGMAGKTADDETVETVVRTDPLPGRTLDDRYKLLARLGQGGMGTVYRARRVHIGDEVAVKVLHRDYSTEEDIVERFRREARAAAALRHPNVVTIYDYSETRSEALAYIVMELVPGVPLGQLLKNGNRLPLKRAVALMSHICAGVGAAHHRQIVHRDLKPDNVIVVPPGSDGETETARVVDFGIARLRDLAATRALTQSGMIIGTPFYMSPEQCRGDETDARSDVYSLGVMFYEMIAGLRPFNAPTPTGVIARHLTQAPPPLHATLNIPRAVEAVLMRALAKDPQARQVDATAFARELEMAVRQAVTRGPEDVIAPDYYPVAARPLSRALRNSIIATMALVCLIAGAVALLSPKSTTPQLLKATQHVESPVDNPTPISIKPVQKTRSTRPDNTSRAAASTRSKVTKPQSDSTQNQPSVRALTEGFTRLPKPKARSRANTEYPDEIKILAPVIDFIEAKSDTGRSSAHRKTDSFPPGMIEMLKPGKGRTIKARLPNGTVTTVYIPRQQN